MKTLIVLAASRLFPGRSPMKFTRRFDVATLLVIAVAVVLGTPAPASAAKAKGQQLALYPATDGPSPTATGKVILYGDSSSMTCDSVGVSVSRMAPNASFYMPVRVAKVGHDADETIQPSAAIAALMYAADIHADVVNMSWKVDVWKFQASWVQTYPPEWHSVAIRTVCARAANYAHEHGVTLVAGAGNYSLDFDHYSNLISIPRDLPHVISVSATGPIGRARNPATDLDLPALYTDYGQSAIDLAAPGGEPAADSDLATVGGITLPRFVFDIVLSTSSRFAAQFGDLPEDPYEPNGTWTWPRQRPAGRAAKIAEEERQNSQPKPGCLSPEPEKERNTEYERATNNRTQCHSHRKLRTGGGR
jgi:Subtilase family